MKIRYLMILILVALSSCADGWYNRPAYEFLTNRSKDNGEYLISELKKFKSRHPIYEVYIRDSMGICKSKDHYFYNGAYNVYCTYFYLPRNKCYVTLDLNASELAVESLSFTLYLMGYTELKNPNTSMDNCSMEWGETYIFENRHKTDEQKKVEKEVDEIMLQIGKYKKR